MVDIDVLMLYIYNSKLIIKYKLLKTRNYGKYKKI